MIKVDVEKVLEAKNPSLAKRLPRFLKNYLKRIVHQDEINTILESFGEMDYIEFIRRALDFMEVSYHATGMENIDPHGRYLFASNHPFGGMDGLMIAERINSATGSQVKSISNDILAYVEPIRPLILPINKHGRQSREAAEQINRVFASDEQIQTFPAGLCSRRIKGKITDLKWQTNFVKKAIEYKRDIVPVHVDGRLSNFFYNLSNLRKALGIKANIEMLYLVNEMFKQKGKDFEIVFGKPIIYTSLAEMGDWRTMTEYVRKASYGLKNNEQ